MKPFQFILPVLAVLNAADAIGTYSLFQIFGSDAEANPLIKGLLTYEPSASLFVLLKLGLSGLILLYWKRSQQIPVLVNDLCLAGIAAYGCMFLHGAYTLLSI